MKKVEENNNELVLDVVYYAVIYLKDLDDILTEIHMKPFELKEDAKKCCEKTKKKFGKRVIKTRVRRTDLSKKADEFWI